MVAPRKPNIIWWSTDLPPADPYLTAGVATTCTEQICEHKNGSYSLIPFFFFFSRRVFHCHDCGESLWGKKLRAYTKEVNDDLQNNRR